MEIQERLQGSPVEGAFGNLSRIIARTKSDICAGVNSTAAVGSAAGRKRAGDCVGSGVRRIGIQKGDSFTWRERSEGRDLVRK